MFYLLDKLLFPLIYLLFKRIYKNSKSFSFLNHVICFGLIIIYCCIKFYSHLTQSLLFFNTSTWLFATVGRNHPCWFKLILSSLWICPLSLGCVICWAGWTFLLLQHLPPIQNLIKKYWSLFLTFLVEKAPKKLVKYIFYNILKFQS